MSFLSEIKYLVFCIMYVLFISVDNDNMNSDVSEHYELIIIPYHVDLVAIKVSHISLLCSTSVTIRMRTLTCYQSSVLLIMFTVCYIMLQLHTQLITNIVTLF